MTNAILMKSLRYLFVVLWLCIMTSLGMFSDIATLGGIFETSHRGGDAYGTDLSLEKFIRPEQPVHEAPAEKTTPACAKTLCNLRNDAPAGGCKSSRSSESSHKRGAGPHQRKPVLQRPPCPADSIALVSVHPGRPTGLIPEGQG